MMTPDPNFDILCTRLGVEDPVDLLHTILHIIKDVYRTNGSRHDVEVGDDASTFGFNVYRHSWAQIERGISPYAGVFTDRENGSLTIHTPGLRLKIYRGGSDETFDIRSYDFRGASFTKRQFITDNFHQPSLFSNPDTGFHPSLQGWFLVHSGNPDQGLTGAWMGIPRWPTIEDHSPWTFIVQLPDLCAERGCGGESGEGGHSLAPSPFRPSGPSFDHREEPEVQIHLKDQEDVADGS